MSMLHLLTSKCQSTSKIILNFVAFKKSFCNLKGVGMKSRVKVNPFLCCGAF